MAREFLTINGVNVEPTEENIVNAVKKHWKIILQKKLNH